MYTQEDDNNFIAVAEALLNGKVEITFAKEDGTEIVVLGTTSDDFIPADMVAEAPKGIKRQDNGDLISMFDLDAGVWIKVPRILFVSFEEVV